MRKLQFAILLIFLLVMNSCHQSSVIQQINEQGQGDESITIQQANSDLLNGVSKAVCYSGFRTGQHPDRGEGAVNPSYDEVLEDMKIISDQADFGLIRLYDSGENSALVLKVIRENNIEVKVMLGIWLKAELSNHETCAWLTEPIAEEILQQNRKLNMLEIEKGIKLARAFEDIVVAVNVGNEALVDWNDHKVDIDTIISYVQQVKHSINQLVTVADNYKWWADHGTALAKEVDFISVHIYPIWEGKDIEDGLSYSIENIMEVKKALPDAKMVISEAGWPSVASEFSEQANEDNQLRHYEEIMNLAREMNISTFWFEAFDEDWKGNPDNMMGAEKHWGLYGIDRKPKKVMQQN